MPQINNKQKMYSIAGHGLILGVLMFGVFTFYKPNVSQQQAVDGSKAGLALALEQIAGVDDFETFSLEDSTAAPPSLEVASQTFEAESGDDYAAVSSQEIVVLSTAETTPSQQPQGIAGSNTSVLDGQVRLKNIYQERIQNDVIITSNGELFEDLPYQAFLESTDPYANDWWHDTVDTPTAWDQTTGSSDTVVAVLDGGFALNHEELAGRWHQNLEELGVVAVEQPSLLNCTDQGLSLDSSCNRIDDDFDGLVDNETGVVTAEHSSSLNCTDQGLTLDRSCNLIDDDGNGFVDDYRGWDFINHDRSVEAGEVDSGGNGVSHGTQVAGIIAASGSNGVGIAGVNWNAQILPLQVLDDEGSGSSIGIARAIRFARLAEVDVINLSLGSLSPDEFVFEEVSRAIDEGIVVVAAAGNDGCDCLSYPANYPEVVAVGATRSDGLRASFSSYGDNLDFVAPGQGLTLPRWDAAGSNSEYSAASGTSFSSPLVAGAYSLLIAQHPDASPLQLSALIHEQLYRSANIPNDSIRTGELGFGELNLGASSLRAAESLDSPLLYSYGGVTEGAIFDGIGDTFNREESVAYACQPGSNPWLPVFKLENSNDTFEPLRFELNPEYVDYYVAQLGYSKTLIDHACVLQLHDSPQIIRQLNLSDETANQSPLKPF